MKRQQLKPDPKNARKHGDANKAMIRASLEEVGAFRSIGVDANNIIRAGNGVYEQAQALGLKVRVIEAKPDELIAVKRVDLKGKRAERAALYDNRTAELSEWDVDALRVMRASNADLLAGVFEADDLTDLLGAEENGTADAEPQIDRAEELNKKWNVKMGDLFCIGEHRLLCGDSTKREDVERLMGGGIAELLITSPPYGVGKDYESGALDDWRETIRGAFSIASEVSCLWVVNLANRRTGNDGFEVNTFAEMERIFTGIGHRLINLRIWAKDAAWAGQSPYWLHTYKSVDDFEFIGIFSRDKPKYKKRLTDIEYKQWGWCGVWRFDSVKRNEVHSAMFPLELPSRVVKLTTDAQSTIYEPFAGSGTTLVACQNLQRKCRAIEISPNYCAVILERMATAFPGIEIERIEESRVEKHARAKAKANGKKAA